LPRVAPALESLTITPSNKSQFGDPQNLSPQEEEIIKLFIAAIEVLPLQKLNIIYADIASQSWPQIFAALSTKDLHELSFKGSGINGALLKTFTEFLPEFRVLTSLDLEQNYLDADECEILCDALGRKTAPLLSRLKLSFNSLHNEGAAALASLMNKSRSLSHIEIFSCGIGNDGAIAIARALPHSHLLSLNLGDNFLGNIAISEFGTILQDKRTTLRELDLAMRSATYDEIDQAIGHNEADPLMFDHELIEDETALQLAAALEGSRLKKLVLQDPKNPILYHLQSDKVLRAFATAVLSIKNAAKIWS